MNPPEPVIPDDPPAPAQDPSAPVVDDPPDPDRPTEYQTRRAG